MPPAGEMGASCSDPGSAAVSGVEDGDVRVACSPARGRRSHSTQLTEPIRMGNDDRAPIPRLEVATSFRACTARGSPCGPAASTSEKGNSRTRIKGRGWWRLKARGPRRVTSCGALSWVRVRPTRRPRALGAPAALVVGRVPGGSADARSLFRGRQAGSRGRGFGTPPGPRSSSRRASPFPCLSETR